MNQLALRAGDFARSQHLNQTYKNTAKEIDLARNQATSGFKGNTYKDIGVDAESALAVSIAKKGAEQYRQNMDLVDQRLDRAETGVNKIITIMQEFRSRLAGVVQPDNLDTAFRKFCDDSLTEIAQTLNIQDVGRNNIFGGNEWSTPPVDLAALPVPTLGGGISKAYYQGTPDVLSASINEGKTLQYGVTADNDAFAKAFHALKIGASIQPDYQKGSNNTLLLQNAMTVGAQATTELSETLAAIGTDRKTIETERGIINRFVESADNLEKDYITADVTEAWIKYKQLENQILGIAVSSKIDVDLGKQLVSILS